jgi:hypothetical protein
MQGIVMDLNQLIFLHQASLMRADAARGGKDFDKHRTEANHCAARIHALRNRMGATGRMTFAVA